MGTVPSTVEDGDDSTPFSPGDISAHSPVTGLIERTSLVFLVRRLIDCRNLQVASDVNLEERKQTRGK